MYNGLFERIEARGEAQALHCDDGCFSYLALNEAVANWQVALAAKSLPENAVVALRGDYGLSSIALLLALLKRGQVVVAIPARSPRVSALLDTAAADCFFDFQASDQPEVEWLQPGARPPLLTDLAERKHGGLVVFSSGTTGENKAALFDFEVLSARYTTAKRVTRTLAFLFLDHLGGINTLLHTLAAGGTLIATRDRSPAAICECIASRQVEVLPATPTFLRMLMVSRLAKKFDLSSLQLITYGTEPMPASTLEGLRNTFPSVRFKQTYGLSELGVLPSRSPDPASLWLQLGGVGCETRVEHGVLFIRSETAMMGYLNATSPFDQDGWYNTHDLVETDGPYVRILGRSTDVINVGGEKVHPVEIESAILTMPNIADVTVWGKDSPITGQIVAARLTLARPEELADLERRVYRHCRECLDPFKIPAHVEISEHAQVSDRFKKVRRNYGSADVAGA